MVRLKKGEQRSVRLEERVEAAVEAWLGKHPGVSRSQLINMALWSFTTTPQTFAAIDDKEVSKSKKGKSVA